MSYSNTLYELAQIRSGLAHALASVEGLRQHGELDNLGNSVAHSLAEDIQRASDREQWLRTRLERGDGRAA